MSVLVSLILPFYNEESNIEPVMREAVEVLSSLTPKYEIIAVNDGSVDETRFILETLARTNPRIVPVHHRKNEGYGAALASGIARATGERVLLADGDGQFYLRELRGLYELLDDVPVVLGFRIVRKDSFVRKLNSFIYNVCARVLIGVKVRDINCAMKAFRRSALRGVRVRTRGALINSDILSQVLATGVRFTEVGVNHKPRLSGEQTGAQRAVIVRAMGEFLGLLAQEFPRRAREILFGIRIFLGFALAGVLVVVSRPNPDELFWVGMGIALAGVLLRNWASGYIKKTKELCVSGPYAFVRHPLYVGTYLIGIGALCSLWHQEYPLVFLGVAILAIGLVLAVYVPKARTEERNLTARFGEAYTAYMRRVGRFFPLPRWNAVSFRDFAWAQYRKNKEYKSLIGLTVFYLILYWKR